MNTVSGTYRTTVGTMSYMYVLWTVVSAYERTVGSSGFDRLLRADA